MKLLQRLVITLAFTAGLAGITPVFAADNPAAAGSKAQTKDLVLNKDARCTTCHDESDAPELLGIGKTRHGTTADGRTPTCVSCHGLSDKHADFKGKDKPPVPDVTFGKNTKNTAQERSAACASCHKKDANRSHWEGSTHQSRDVTCTSCHQTHTQHDKVRNKRTEAEVCYACHKEQRSQMNRVSHHPVPEGKMGCSDCHNAHGSVAPKLMKRDSVNETCYTCHMEKRGPFVHNHAPVQEDCALCHNAHGSNVENMLKVRAPFLCHQCHSPHGGNLAQLANQTAPGTTVGRNGVTYTQGRGCVSCHTQVHGGNNPARANPNAQYMLR